MRLEMSFHFHGHIKFSPDSINAAAEGYLDVTSPVATRHEDVISTWRQRETRHDKDTGNGTGLTK